MKRCPVCGCEQPEAEFTSGDSVPAGVVEAIRRRQPAWTTQDALCDDCLHDAMMDHMEVALETEQGPLSDQERDVIHRMRRQEVMSTDINRAFDQALTAAERVAQRITGVIGSWFFATLILVSLALWVGVNVRFQPFDPYPVIVLSVLSATLGSLAAIEGPIILMTQRRQAKRDRLQSENDYRVNLKAELEIRYLQEQIDHLLMQQQRLLDVQHTQTALLQHLSERRIGTRSTP